MKDHKPKDSQCETIRTCKKTSKFAECACKKSTEAVFLLKRLASLECTPIDAIPVTGLIVTRPGCYQLINEISFTGSVAITIMTNDVMIDLGGFTLTLDPASIGITSTGFDNLVIANGTILSSAPGTTGIGISLTNVDNFVIKKIRTDSEFLGINLTSCTNGSMIKCIQENHGINFSSGAFFSTGPCSNITFDGCQYSNNLFAVGNPVFGSNLSIFISGSPNQNFRFTSCQFYNTELSAMNVNGLYYSDNTLDSTNSQDSDDLIGIYNCYGVIIKDSTFTNLNMEPHSFGIGLYSGANMLVEGCVIEANPSGYAPDTIVPEYPVGIISIGSSWGPFIFGGGPPEFTDNVTIRDCVINGGPAPTPSFNTTSSSVDPKGGFSLLRRSIAKNEHLSKQVAPVSSPPGVRAFRAISIQPGCTAIRIENCNMSHFNSGDLPILPATSAPIVASPIFGGAIRVDGSDSVEILNCSVTDVAAGPGTGGNGIVLGGNYVFSGTFLTTTTAPFIQPAVGANVIVSVADSSGIAGLVSPTIEIAGGGIYAIVSVNSPTSITVTNTGSIGNAPPGTIVATGAIVRVGTVIPATTNCTIKGCVVTNCNGDGILNQGNGNIIVDNQVANNGNFGIENQGTENNISDNTSSNNITSDYFGVPAVISQGTPSIAGQNISI